MEPVPSGGRFFQSQSVRRVSTYRMQKGFLHTVFFYNKPGGETVKLRRNSGGFGTIAGTLIRFSLPLILSGVLQQLYNWADAFIVGNVEGELALAAIGATGTVVGFCLMILTGFTLGLAILFAQRFGAGETDFLPKLLSTFTFLLGLAGLGLAAAGAMLAGPLLSAMNTTPDTIGLAEDYLRLVFLGVPFLAVYNVYSAALRGMGDSRAPFLAVLFSSLLNVALDVLFVAVFHWGVAGAAWATVLSQAGMAVFLVVYAVSRRPQLRFHFGRKMVDRAALLQGARMGLPPMLQSSVNAFGNLLLQNFMNGFGTQTVAAITTAYRIDSIIMLPLINLGSGISTVVAQNYGAGEHRRAGQTFLVGTGMMAGVSLLLTALVIPTGGPLIAMFGVGPEAVEIGRSFFLRFACFYLVFGLATAVRGYLEGLGDVVYSSVTGGAALIVRILASYALAPLWGNMVIAYAEGISWGVLLLMYLLRLPARRLRETGA